MNVCEPIQNRLIKLIQVLTHAENAQRDTQLLLVVSRAQMASRQQMFKQRIGRVRPHRDRNCLHSCPLLYSLDMFDQLLDIIPLSLFHSTLLGLLT